MRICVIKGFGDRVVERDRAGDRHKFGIDQI
jgi:hypothetical protein